MKFICNTEFFHSGNRLYTSGAVYNDITEKTAEELIAVDTKIPLGALSFFTPVDEEALTFMKAKGWNETQKVGEAVSEQSGRAKLIAEAKNLGIKGADKMTEAELKEAIEAAKKNPQG